ncbi:MAG: hypothetical protein QOD84_2508, partial [Acidobacteriaceae bacterium]
MGPPHVENNRLILSLTGFADHLNVGDLQMTVFVIALLHAAVFRGIFGILFNIVLFGIRDYSRRGDRM